VDFLVQNNHYGYKSNS